MTHTRRIAITPGEPAGIGPELVVRLAQSAHDIELTAISDPKLLKQYAALLGLSLDIRETSAETPPIATGAGEIACIPVALNVPVRPGHLEVRNAEYVLSTLDLANQLCLSKRAQAIVTGPVQKAS